MTTFLDLFASDEEEVDAGDLLDELVYDGKIDGAELVDGPHIVAHGRWSLTKRIVFHAEGRFYRLDYDVPATEMQDNDPFDYTDGELVEVFPKEVTTTVYEPA